MAVFTLYFRLCLFSFISLLVSTEGLAFYQSVAPTMCAPKTNFNNDNQDSDCAEAKKAKEIIPQLAADEQLVGVSTRNDRPNEIFAIIVKTGDQGKLSEIIFQKFVREDNKMDGKLVPSSEASHRVVGNLLELNERGGFTIHKESGGIWPVTVTRKVLHLRAMSESEVDALNYDPTSYDISDYKREIKKPTDNGPRIGRVTPENGGRLWLSYAKDARGSGDSVWESGFEFYLTAEVSKDPQTGIETRRWKLSRDAEAQKLFDTIPLVVNKDGDDLNGVSASELTQRIARVLSGEAVASQTSLKVSDRESKVGSSTIMDSTPESSRSGGSLQSSNGF